MKYKAEVDSENRNISPRNDLLRKRKCVGIIQAAEAHMHGHVYALTTMEQSRCVPTLVAAVREGGGLNQPSRCPGLRQRCGAELSEATRKSVCVEVILIKEFKSHSRGDDFSFSCDSDV